MARTSKGLWDDIDGERWLDNPLLITAGNPTRKRKKMARRRVSRKRGRKAAPRRRARRNYAASGLIANPRRRRRRKNMAAFRRAPRRHGLIGRPRRRRVRHNRAYRRNPGLMGIQLPALQDVLFTGAGIVIPPVMTSMLLNYLPADWRTSKAAYYGVKAASVLIPSMLVRKFVSRRAGNLMLIGGAASFAIDLVREFAPSLLPGGSVGAQPFLGGGVGFYERMPRQVGMGRYSSVPVRSVPVQRTPLLSMTPERLSPGARY